MANERKAQLLFKELLAGLSDDIRKVYEKQTDVSKDISLSIDDNLYKNVCILSTVIINDMLSKGADIEKYMQGLEADLSGNKILIADDIDKLSHGLLELVRGNDISKYLQVCTVESERIDDFINSAIELYAIYFKIDIEDDTDELDDDMKFDIDNDVRQIMSIYDIIYAPLFEMEPVGILTSKGVIYIDNELNTKVKNVGKRNAVIAFAEMNKHYSDAIKELEYTETVSIKNCINSDGSLKINYIPGFHVKNIFGIVSERGGGKHRVKKWGDFRTNLQNSLKKKITEIIKDFCSDESKDDLSKANLARNLVELFTTVFIAEEFDNKSFKLTSKSVTLGKKLIDIGNLVTSGKMFPSYDRSMIKLIDNSEIEQGVFGLLTIFDVAAYNGEILFAYKAIQKILESGGSISLNKTLLGKDIRGRNITYNFEGESNTNSLIIAGSGSGKGVMTLNILATFIACGCPTVYVDWKPDMAAMLWELERQTGAKILAIDGAMGSKEGIIPVRNYGTGVNAPNIDGITEKLNVIPYLKMMQIMILCAVARSSGYNGMSKKGAKMQFILDEAQQMNNVLRDLGKAIDNYLKANKPSKTNPKTPEYEYVEKINNLIAGIASSIAGFKNTFGRQGNVGLIMLGQQADASAWSEGNMKRDTMGYLVGNCTMKLLGRGATDSTKYNLGDAEPVGRDLLGNMGYFALVEGNLANKSMNIPVVKSYLVLNDNDYSPSDPGAFTSGLLKNITDDTIKQSVIENDLYPNGVVNERVGFRGLMQYMGSKISNFDLNTNLELGYRTVEKLLVGLGILGTGKYTDVESYVFDLSPDAIYTTAYLQQLIQNGGKVSGSGEISSEDTNSSDDDFNVYDDSMYYCQTCGHSDTSPISIPCPMCGGNPNENGGTWTCDNGHKVSINVDKCPQCGALRDISSDSDDEEDTGGWADDTEETDDGVPEPYDGFGGTDESSDDTEPEPIIFNTGKDEVIQKCKTCGYMNNAGVGNPCTHCGGDPNVRGNTWICSNCHSRMSDRIRKCLVCGVDIDNSIIPEQDKSAIPVPPPTSQPSPFSHTEASTYNDTPENSYTEPYESDFVFKDDGKFHLFGDNAMIKQTSANLLSIIEEVVGNLSRVNTVSIENGGHIIVNGIHINPSLSDEQIQQLPLDLRHKVSSGQWFELFHGKDLAKFKNLRQLIIADMSMADKVCLDTGKADVFKLRAWLESKTALNSLIVAGVEVREEEHEYMEDASRGSNFVNGVHGAFAGIKGIGGALLGACRTVRNSRIWNSPVGHFAKGVAGVAGIAVALPFLSGLIAGLGFFGTLNLAIACAGGAYNVVRHRKNKAFGSSNTSGFGGSNTSGFGADGGSENSGSGSGRGSHGRNT